MPAVLGQHVFDQERHHVGELGGGLFGVAAGNGRLKALEVRLDRRGVAPVLQALALVGDTRHARERHFEAEREAVAKDVVLVLDSSLIGLVPVTDGLKPDGKLIVNTPKTPEEIRRELNFQGTVATVDGTGIARKEMGVPIANTTMIGALLKVIGVMELDAMKDAIDHRFGRIAQKNLNAMKRAYDEITIYN